MSMSKIVMGALLAALLLLLGLGCTTTPTDCSEMCKAEGKKMKSYEAGFFAVRCECADPAQP